MFEETDSVFNMKSVPSNVYKSFKTQNIPMQIPTVITEIYFLIQDSFPPSRIFQVFLMVCDDCWMIKPKRPTGTRLTNEMTHHWL